MQDRAPYLMIVPNRDGFRVDEHIPAFQSWDSVLNAGADSQGRTHACQILVYTP